MFLRNHNKMNHGDRIGPLRIALVAAIGLMVASGSGHAGDNSASSFNVLPLHVQFELEVPELKNAGENAYDEMLSLPNIQLETAQRIADECNDGRYSKVLPWKFEAVPDDALNPRLHVTLKEDTGNWVLEVKVYDDKGDEQTFFVVDSADVRRSISLRETVRREGERRPTGYPQLPETVHSWFKTHFLVQSEDDTSDSGNQDGLRLHHRVRHFAPVCLGKVLLAHFTAPAWQPTSEEDTLYGTVHLPRADFDFLTDYKFEVHSESTQIGRSIKLRSRVADTFEQLMAPVSNLDEILLLHESWESTPLRPLTSVKFQALTTALDRQKLDMARCYLYEYYRP